MPRAVLGILYFGQVNEAQSRNQRYFWKADSARFPTGHHGANFDIGKSTKTWLQVDLFSNQEGAAFLDLALRLEKSWNF